MSDASSRTLLSLWGIKQTPPTDCLKPDIINDNNGIANQIPTAALSPLTVPESSPPRPEQPQMAPPAQVKQVDRAKSASQWNSIFSKPKKNASQESQPSSQESESTISSVEPQKPAPSRMVQLPNQRDLIEASFLHIFKARPENLANIKQASPCQNGSSPSSNVGTTSPEKPLFIHTFRVSPEKLKTIKPRIHSFFAKRPTSVSSGAANSTRKSNSLRPLDLKYPPWSIVHVRPVLTYDSRYSVPLAKRRRRQSIEQGSGQEVSTDWRLLVPQLPTLKASCDSLPHLPTRALYSSEQLRALAALSQSKRNGDFLNDLIKTSGEPKPFDSGKFEGTMWCEKYAPQKPSHHLLSIETQKVADWAATQMQKRQKQRKWPLKRKRRNIDDFVVEDEDVEEDLDDILLVCGPCGSGKTSAVYAAAKALNAFVFEVNCSTKRTGKELSSLLDGISHNHAVHNAKSCIILVDDGDIVYENEAGGFWATISRFTATSRRPVIVTCTDPSRIALSDLGTSIVRMNMPDLIRVTDIAWTIALSEGYVLNKTDVAAAAVMTKGDMRRILAHLQFWCQMGIGGLPSGVDWYAKDYEFMQNSARRVVSEQSWCPPLSNEDEPDPHIVLPPPPPPPSSSPSLHSQNLESHFNVAESLSELDSAFEPFTIEHRYAPEETISGNGSTVLSEWRAPTISRPSSLYPYLSSEKASYLPVIRDIFADEYAIGTSRDSLIAEDIAPYMREIAACDFRRALIMEQGLAQQQSARGMRMTRRMWAASGIDSRQYLGHSMSSLRLFLSTCLPAQLFEPGSG